MSYLLFSQLHTKKKAFIIKLIRNEISDDLRQWFVPKSVAATHWWVKEQSVRSKKKNIKIVCYKKKHNMFRV